MSLLTSAQSSQEGRISLPSTSTHTSPDMSEIKQPHSSAEGYGQSGHGQSGHGQSGHGVRPLPVKPELPPQHPVETIKSTNHSQAPSSTGPQRSSAGLNGSRHGMGSGIMDACSRYGISGRVLTPSSPESNLSNAYGGAVMSQGHQSYNSYSSSSRPSLSAPPGHCVPNAFNFSVNNLIHRNYPKI